MSKPEFAVIIPHYNDQARLMRCLAALMPQMEGQEGELVVVDNNSGTGLDDLRRSYPDLRLLVEEKQGAAEARNRGVAETTAPVVLFLDCDCVPAANWLEMALAQADLGDVVGGQISVFDETPAPRSGAEAFETVFAFDNRAYVERKGFSVTANLVTRRDVFEATGPFVAGLSEDLDWCRRATALGFSLAYAEAMQVAHPTRANWQALAKKWRRLTEEGFGVHGNSFAARCTWGARALLMGPSAMVHSLRIWRARDLSWRERLRAVWTLWRLRLTRMVWMLGQAL